MINFAHIQRIRYVTSHFNVLKGLTLVPWGVYYLLGAVYALWAPDLPDGVGFAILLLGLFLTIAAHMLLLNYYQQAFGEVGPARRGTSIALSNANRLNLLCLWIGFAVIALALGLLALWTMPIIDPQLFSIFIYRLLAAILACTLCFALWLHKRIVQGYARIPIWPLAIYLICTLEPPAFLRDGSATMILESSIIAITLLCAGIYNHLLLARSLKPIEE